MKKTLLTNSLFALFLFCIAQSHQAQPMRISTTSEIQIALEKLNVLGSVLYIAAHPDDENTSLMAYLSKGEKFRTGYLSLTRGDGGQNLIGSEKGVEIGILRTQELLQARKFDNGEQYFTRAIDFGFSKSPEETFQIWNKEEVLKDIVWVIRNFQPDVIITRFPLNGDGGHGHHTASAFLAEEAFHAAADPQKFSEQLKYVQPWQAKRIFWNSWRPENTNGLLSVNTGEYNPLLAESYTETGAKSRTMHKSQGFGSVGSRGSRLEFFQLIDGDSAKINLWDDINTTWSRIENGEHISKSIESIIKNFSPSSPSSSIPALVLLYDELNKLPQNCWVEIKKKELREIIKSCAGLWMEAIAEDYSAAPGDEISLKTTIVNRSDTKFKIEKIEFPAADSDSLIDKELNNNQPLTIGSKIKIPTSYKISQPYWLEEKSSKGLFKVSDIKMVGLAENSFSVPVKITFDCEGKKLDYTIPLLFRWNDRADGELYRPFEIRPSAIVNLIEKVAVFPDEKQKEIQVKVKSNSTSVKGFLHFEKTDGWKITPSEIPFELKNKYDEKLISFTVTPPEIQGETDLRILLNINGKDYDKSLVEISYPHIVPQVYFPQSDLKLVRLNIEKVSGRIGYIMGSGDDIPGCLSNMGYEVNLISDEMLEGNHLSQFNAIITGVRAYNTRERLKFAQPKLLEYVKNGGTLIVQYNVAFGLQTQDIGPYPFRISQDRITDEDAVINFLDPKNQLLNFPNKITEKDFEGWIQERGLYFADQWDSNYKTVFSGHDDNEKDLYGGMLFTKYGKGVFIYSGYSWFRQLPAGVPGAYRIFINMISAGKYGR
jgi:LmbE family N-acetylglucosaminyl deacetylase